MIFIIDTAIILSLSMSIVVIDDLEAPLMQDDHKMIVVDRNEGVKNAAQARQTAAKTKEKLIVECLAWIEGCIKDGIQHVGTGFVESQRITLTEEVPFKYYVDFTVLNAAVIRGRFSERGYTMAYVTKKHSRYSDDHTLVIEFGVTRRPQDQLLLAYREADPDRTERWCQRLILLAVVLGFGVFIGFEIFH